MSCVIGECISHSGRKGHENEFISFHRFPKDEEIKKAWISCVNRNRINWTWKCHSRICSKHFTPDSFTCSEDTKWRRLRESAIPTLYLTDRLVYGTTPICNTSAEPSCNQQPTISKRQQEIVRVKNISELRMEKTNTLAKETLCGTTQRCNSSGGPTCNQHERIISRLQQELEKAKKVSQQRLRKINTLTKRLSRITKRTEDLRSILFDRLEQEEVETEYSTMSENINKNDFTKAR